MTETDVNIYPYLYYDDAPAAIEWLKNALGFETVMVIPDKDGRVAHSELRYGAGIVMIGSSDSARGAKSALEAGGATGGTCIYVDDAGLDAHYARAEAAGAIVHRPLESKDYGGRGYSVRDPEGQEWSIGSYRAGDPANA